MIQYQHGYNLLEVFKNYGTSNNVLTRFSNGNGQMVISSLNVVLKAIAP